MAHKGEAKPRLTKFEYKIVFLKSNCKFSFYFTFELTFRRQISNLNTSFSVLRRSFHTLSNEKFIKWENTEKQLQRNFKVNKRCWSWQINSREIKQKLENYSKIGCWDFTREEEKKLWKKTFHEKILKIIFRLNMESEKNNINCGSRVRGREKKMRKFWIAHELK